MILNRNKSMICILSTGLLALMIGSGCGKGDSGYPAASGPHAGGAPAAGTAGGASGESRAAAAGRTAVVAGVSFAPPSAWQDLGPSGMRQGQYQLAPVSGDPAPAEVNVFYFGPQSGGGVEANLQRWIGQMVLPDGGDPAAAAAREHFTADGMPGHIVSLDGSYKSGGMRPMDPSGPVLPGYRLVGVVLEGPQGSVFFKLTGPAATARAMESDLLAMVKAAHR